jgi:hypothetical protein
MMTRAAIVARSLSRSGREPSRRLLREHNVRGTDAELDAVVLAVLVTDGWIVEPVDRGKATTSVAYRNARKLRDRANTRAMPHNPAYWDQPKGGA